ncbi:MAG: prepilin-type N-terminal cleavage/methylation domain-containing protein, partial [Bacilli bacterium]|nr:prepilin-type N-terminal cleavage/methylation domain-containing protein [Bacilli bacterium]
MRKKGFTLIELLAVIVILAVIALIATPIILNIIEKARKSA